MAKRRAKKLNKQQRKDALVSARAELALLLDGNKHTARAMSWSLLKTLGAVRQMQEFGSLPFSWTLGDIAEDGFFQTTMAPKLKPLA
jgi:hypothetical protein